MANLTPEQKQSVTQWIQAGSGLSDVQKRLRDELGVSLTYMDVRLLVLEMGLSVKEKAKQTPSNKDLSQGASKSPGVPPQGEDMDDDGMDESGMPGQSGAGQVSVTLDRIVKPGSLASGNVTFSDGVSMGWSLDQFGRLALSGGKPGYKPSQQDVMGFQTQLRRVLEQKGF